MYFTRICLHFRERIVSPRPSAISRSMRGDVWLVKGHDWERPEAEEGQETDNAKKVKGCPNKYERHSMKRKRW